METVATVCDDIIECFNGEDEPDDCKRDEGNIYLAISVGSILTIYLGLKLCLSIDKRIQSNRKRNGKRDKLNLNTILINETDIAALRQMLNGIGLYIKNLNDEKAKKKFGLKVFSLEEKVNKNEALVFTSIHNNYIPEVANMIIDAKFPGFVEKHLSFLRNIFRYLTRSERFYSTRLLIGNLITIISQYSDNFNFSMRA